MEYNGNLLCLDDLNKIIFNNENLFLTQPLLNEIQESYNFLKKFSKNKIIYGINTGFGPMAQYRINEEDLQQLQYNLIRSHCTGSGGVLPAVYVRAAILCRLISLLKGYSGVHSDTIKLLSDFLNHEIYPVIFSHGSVGASGDLVQLAHLALALIGEGEVSYQGKKQKTEEVLNELGLKKLEIHVREGLALINGTSCMTGISIVNLVYAKKMLNLSILASAMVNEAVNACDDHFSEELNQKKLHYGQQEVAKKMGTILKDSKLIRYRKKDYYETQHTEEIFEEKVQEYYSLRCVPQIIGPVLDTILHVEQTVVDEVNSSNDNPVVDYKTETVYHGGNFHGDYISLEMDKLKIAIIRLSQLMERQLNYLLNSKLNEKFPPFLNLGTLGLNLGMQAMQFTATSTVAENQSLGYPNYLHTIPNNADNQDIVSMGTNSALLTKQVIENSFEVLAIHFIAILQA
ncbi:MAG: aromatic amino acid ammonia-lyase, partial [Bacteroidetes bacterium]|nr:aromatic amino acid ammonia-lyase [Bacteroidota bacterium]